MARFAALERKSGGSGAGRSRRRGRRRRQRSGSGVELSVGTSSLLSSLAARGQPLPASTRDSMEARFGHDFGDVRLHSGPGAERAADSLHARAFTAGRNIVFGQGEYRPSTASGERLLAHELTHVVQQGATRPLARRGGPSALPVKPVGGSAAVRLQRDCSDATFCTPYTSSSDAASAESLLRSVYLPADGAKFGADSRALFESYLSRAPGDSLTPQVFDDPSRDLVQSFADSGATADDQDAIIDLIGARLHLAPGGRPSPHTPTMMSVSNFLSPSEMNDRPVNYSNPLSIAGHVAGGIGSSDAGPDYRNVSYGNVTLTNVPLFGSTGYVHVETTLHYEVFDAIDFCPGDCGSPAEQYVTIPMSRLEATGEAYDVPFLVRFIPESRAKRFFY